MVNQVSNTNLFNAFNNIQPKTTVVTTPAIETKIQIPQTPIKADNKTQKNPAFKKKLAIGASAATAIGTIITAGIMISRGNGFKYIDSLNESGQKVIEKFTKKENELLERKIFQKNSNKLDSLEEFMDGILYKKRDFYEDGITLKTEKIFGSETKIIENTFTENGNTLKSTILHSNDIKEDFETIYNSDGITQKETNRYINGILNSSTKYKEDGENILTKTLFQEDGKTISAKEELLDDFGYRLIKYQKDGKAISAISYLNKDNIIQKLEMYNKDGKLNKLSEYINGKLSKLTEYRKDGTTPEIINDYEDGVIKKLTAFGEDGKTIQEIEDYINGNFIKETHYREDGKTIDWIQDILENNTAKGIFYKEDGITPIGSWQSTLLSDDDLTLTLFKENGKTVDLVASNYKDKQFGFIEAFNEQGKKLQEVSQASLEKINECINRFL